MTLQNVVPWGRNFDEYRAMFALDAADLNAKILGCGDGPSSFNCELTMKGGSVVSIDPVYRFTEEEIGQRIAETAETVLEQVELHKDKYVWTSIGSVAELEAIRMSAMNRFLEDYDRNKSEGRYIEASLPHLPFADKAFDLVLCSHFLFLYSDHFDLNFHIESVLEMCRTGDEVRIFPLLDLKGRRSSYLEPILEALQQRGCRCEIETVDYEFQRGGNEMLRVTRL